MDRAGAEAAVMTSAIIVGGVWGYRKLTEATASSPAPAGHSLRSLAGLEAAPAPTASFIVGYGFTYMTLSVLAIGAPEVAGPFAVLIAVADVLANGLSVFGDITKQVSAQTALPPARPARSPAKGSG